MCCHGATLTWRCGHNLDILDAGALAVVAVAGGRGGAVEEEGKLGRAARGHVVAGMTNLERGGGSGSCRAAQAVC